MSSKRRLRIPIPDNPVYNRAFKSMIRAAGEIKSEDLDPRFKSNRNALQATVDSNHCFALIFQLKFMAIALIIVTLPEETIANLDLDHIEVIPNRKYINSSTGRFAEADMLYRIPLLGTEEVICLFIILEHKTVITPRAIFQASWYAISEQKSRLDAMDAEWTLKLNAVRDGKMTHEEYDRQRADWEETQIKDFFLQPAIAMIVHQGEKPYEGVTNTGDLCQPLKGLTELYPHHEVKVFELNSENSIDRADSANVRFLGLVLKVYRAIYSPVAPQLLAEVFEQMQEFFDDELCCWIGRILETYARDYSIHFQGEKRREIVQAFTLVEQGEDKMISGWEEAMRIGYDKGVNVGYDKGVNVGYDKGVNVGYDKGVNVGYDKGVNVGYDKGVNKGQINQLIASLLALLGYKYPSGDLCDIQARLTQINDYQKLDALYMAALDTASLDDFRQKLQLA